MARAVTIGRKWGSWRYDPCTFVLDYESDRHNCEVDLDQCEDSASVLDWIMHCRKAWMPPEDLGYLVEAPGDILVARSNLRTSGRQPKIDLQRPMAFTPSRRDSRGRRRLDSGLPVGSGAAPHPQGPDVRTENGRGPQSGRPDLPADLPDVPGRQPNERRARAMTEGEAAETRTDLGANHG
jgi:hypothetical protein